ncbi:dihydrofolate reductase [Candidatus Peregrinibacteria bacterium]|jgi:dihydrofolate reductase|nr:dihydrofolate reductase [Candidatus Peregrinibacteria bacterium]MBT4055740.1 dihydrofolate reductase [Candidatus Peregrinibacteria bacterium]
MKTVLIAAITLDGKISTSSSKDVDWTSKKDKAFFSKELKKAGVSILGRKTYQAALAAKHLTPGTRRIIITRTPSKYKSHQVPGKLEFTNDTPKKIIAKLEKAGHKKAVISGGSEIYASFLKAKLIDEIYLTIAPKIFGKGVPLFANSLQNKQLKNLKLSLASVSKLGPSEVLLKYKVNYSK